MHLFLVAGINAFGQILVQLRREVNLDTVCRPSRDAGTKEIGIFRPHRAARSLGRLHQAQHQC